MATSAIPAYISKANVLREYIANDTWVIPAGLKEILVICVGPGGGGGSGRKAVAGTLKQGGGNGGGGAVVYRRIPVASLAGSYAITIGAAGTGGAGIVAGAQSNGNPGTVGGDTSFGALVIAKGGGAGTAGGVGAGGVDGGLSSACTPAFGPYAWNGRQRAAMPLFSTIAIGGTGMDGSFGAPSGGSGGYVNIATEFAGAAGGGVYTDGTLTAGPAGGAVAGGAGTNGTNDVSNILRLLVGQTSTYGIGTGGSGSGGTNSGLSGVGGNGGRCAGGGGSGAGTTTSKGGDGGGGLCLIVEIYN